MSYKEMQERCPFCGGGLFLGDNGLVAHAVPSCPTYRTTGDSVDFVAKVRRVLDAQGRVFR